MKKYVVDTSLINKLVDGTVGADELPNDGVFVTTHVQIDEINRTKNPERRTKLLEKFSETIDEVLPTESFVLGVSRLDEARLGDGTAYESIMKTLDARNKRKPNNSEDALIAEVAMKNGYVLLTADFDLYQVAYSLGIRIIYWTTT
jgi:predicted nucleic acid-binding protein